MYTFRFLICPLQLFALAENVALRKLQHIEIQPILRILGKELIIARYIYCN